MRHYESLLNEPGVSDLPSVGRLSPRHVVVAVDTSASISDRLLSIILGEIDSLRRTNECGLTIIQCDTEIKEIKTFDSWEVASVNLDTVTFHGRGGTSLIPPFQWAATQLESGHLDIDALIYLTDGYGPKPSEPAPLPCLWVVPEDSDRSFPFGQLLVLPFEDAVP